MDEEAVATVHELQEAWYVEKDYTVRFRGDTPLEIFGEYFEKGESDLVKLHFRLGDAYNWAMEIHGDDVYSLFDAADYEEGTIRNDGWIASRWPVSRRGMEGLKWSHYQELASIKDPWERQMLANRCATGELTIDDLRKYKESGQGDGLGGGDHIEGVECPACFGEGRVDESRVSVSG